MTAEKREFDAQEIIDRMMLAFCNETVRCLEDNIVATASEADMAMIMGVGFLHSVVVHAVTSTKQVLLNTLRFATNMHT